ncbi:unnamed protein product [Amoebophrya sp. A25]|nr:unnamed protein product [Amoebophrya sp. A25]|eukprot:GSA25T00017713001.1
MRTIFCRLSCSRRFATSPCLRGQGQGSSWWQRYVYGLNPANPERNKIAQLFEAERVDPLLLEKDELEHFRKFFLAEQRQYKVEDEAQAWSNVKTKYPEKFRRIQYKFGNTFKTSYTNEESDEAQSTTCG